MRSIVNVWLIFVVLGGLCRYGQATCVLESDFGFVINCAFKKSGLFRVRNLGGVKAHIGLGFSLGDELGFKQSFSNTEGNRRRSASASPLIAQAALLQQQAQKFNLNNSRSSINALQPHSQQQQPYAAIGSVSSAKQTQTADIKSQTASVPPFKPIPPAPERPIMSSPTKSHVASVTNQNPYHVVQHHHHQHQRQHTSISMGVAVPVNNAAMPSSISRISHGVGEKMFPTDGKPSVPSVPSAPPQIAVIMPLRKDGGGGDKMSSTFALRTLSTEQKGMPLRQTNSNYEDVQNLIINPETSEGLDDGLQMANANTTTSRNTTSSYDTSSSPSTFYSSTTTVTSITTPKSKYYKHSTVGKVMNAPKEYYPVGYDKNFDDNFSSRVDLPDTSFRCGDQKHFPGLYADEDLGCMVFHVCALTDDGLIMKSFLCPESTLFDQTILKCNWWFYVDCKNSKKLYDSNIPISKSYQLMKALTFFSSYNKESRNNNSSQKTKSTTIKD